jgi:hypothetical protein
MKMRSVSALGNLRGDFSHSISKARILQRVRARGEEGTLTEALQVQENLSANRWYTVGSPVVVRDVKRGSGDLNRSDHKPSPDSEVEVDAAPHGVGYVILSHVRNASQGIVRGRFTCSRRGEKRTCLETFQILACFGIGEDIWSAR